MGFPISLGDLPACPVGGSCMTNSYSKQYTLLSKSASKDSPGHNYYLMQRASGTTDDYWLCDGCHEAVQSLLTPTASKEASISTLNEKVRTGLFTLLDSDKGIAGVLSVDLNTLNMEDGAGACVLAQVYGSYYNGIKKLGINDVEAGQRGFVATDSETPAELGTEWVKVIKEFRNGSSVTPPADYKKPVKKNEYAHHIKVERSVSLTLISGASNHSLNLGQLKAFVAKCEEEGLNDYTTITKAGTETVKLEDGYDELCYIDSMALHAVLPEKN